MTKLPINLSNDDNTWFEKLAKLRGKTKAAVLRDAIDQFREREERFERLHEAARGTWTQGDTLAYVRKIRAE